MLLLLLGDKKRLCVLCISQTHGTQPFVSKSVDMKRSLIHLSRLLKLVMKRLFQISFFLSLSYVTLIIFLIPYIFAKVFVGFKVILGKVLPETPLMTLQYIITLKITPQSLNK